MVSLPEQTLDPSLSPEPSRGMKVLGLSLGQFLSTVVMLVALIVLSRVLNKEDYATYRQTFLAFQFIAPLLVLGLPHAVYYFLPSESQRVRGRVLDVLAILFLMGCLFPIFLLLGGAELLASRFNNPDLAQSLWYLAVYPFFMLPLGGVLSAVMITRGRITLLSVFNVLSQLLIGLGIIIPALMWRTPDSSILGTVLATVLAGGVGVYLMISVTPRDSYVPRWSSMKEIVSLSVPLGLAMMFGTISKQLDKVIVSAMFTPEEFAIYANGAMEVPLVGIITGSITFVLLVDMRKLIAAGKKEEALALFRLGAEKSALILLPTMIFLLVSAEPFIQTLFSSKYAASATPFRIYLLLLPVRTVVFGSLILSFGKSKLLLFRAIVGLLINFALSLWLVSLMGYLGAAVATVLTIYCWGFSMNLLIIGKLMNVKIHEIIPFAKFGAIVLPLLLPAAGVYGLNALLKSWPSWIQLALGATLFWGFTLIWFRKEIVSTLRMLRPPSSHAE